MKKTISKKKVKAKKVKKPKIILTPAEKKKLAAEKKKKANERAYKIQINTVFKNAGFLQIPTRDTQLTFLDKKGEIDNIFVYENIIVISEDTASEVPDHIADHIRKKAIFFKHLGDNKEDFIDYLSETFPEFKKYRNDNLRHEPVDYRLVFIYCSMHQFESKIERDFKDIIFFNYPYLRYFLSLAKTIHKSSRFELFKFLKLDLKDIYTSSGAELGTIPGFLLPESPSGFQKNFHIVTFYVDPERLLKLSYVLRKGGGWRDSDALYQRLLIKNKIQGMRQYLSENKRVFINNIIVTLPPTTKLSDKNNDTLKTIDRTKAQEIVIQIPYAFDSIGIIDGQHRVYAYHEGDDKFEKDIASKRGKQNLLVTGIIFPQGITEEERLKFESNIFIEINDKQTRVKAELKQDIQAIIKPFDVIAISKTIISKLAVDGPLTNKLEVHFFDTGKIKTSSIVSYALRHIVKFNGNDTLFKVWDNPNKNELLKQEDKKLLKEYINFCVDEINKLFVAYKKHLSKDHMFVLDRKKSVALTTTSVNGLIFCLRKMIQNDKIGTLEEYEEKMEKLELDFSPKGFPYSSSHWKDLGDFIYNECFS